MGCGRVAVGVLLCAVLAGCTSSATVHAYHLTRYIEVAGDATGYDILEGAHCPRLVREDGGFRYDREWMEPVPRTIVYEEWTGPGYDGVPYMGSAHDWFRLEDSPVTSSLDGGLVLATLSLEGGALLVDGATVGLPWNHTFTYMADQPGGTFAVTETLTLEDEGVRPLAIATHWRLTCD